MTSTVTFSAEQEGEKMLVRQLAPVFRRCFSVSTKRENNSMVLIMVCSTSLSFRFSWLFILMCAFLQDPN
jgi:hypothetical protein